jgi:glycerophosphoryl diester phosphodiesterase
MARFIPFVLIVCGLLKMASAVEITAHRGASYLAPENTLAAVNLAWQLGADSVEIDVFQAADRKIVAIHDKDTQRTAGVKWKVADTPLDRLRKLDVGRWKGQRWTGQRIPTLAEVLATIPDDKRLLIEIKCGPEVVPELHRVLIASGKNPAQTAVISFDPHVLLTVRRAMPKLHVQWVVGTIPERDKRTRNIRVTVEEVIASCRQGKFNGLSVRRDSEIDEAFVKQFHDAGLELHVWTVNSPQEAKKLAALGVDAITTDRPGYVRRQLGRRFGQ